MIPCHVSAPAGDPSLVLAGKSAVLLFLFETSLICSYLVRVRSSPRTESSAYASIPFRLGVLSLRRESLLLQVNVSSRLATRC
jgi:hypothetical protein